MALRNFDRAFVEERHRRWPLLGAYEFELHLHPYLTFSLRPGFTSEVVNVDAEGFRLSAAPDGVVDSRSWLARGGGGLVVGSSTAFGAGSSSDRTTLPSRLASLTGERQLNLGLVAGNSVQQLIAALPFVDKASSVAVLSGWLPFYSAIRSSTGGSVFGPLLYEKAFGLLSRDPFQDLVEVLAGKREVVPAAGEQDKSRPSDDEMRLRMEEAVAHQLRDLALLARSVPDRRRLLYCLQPFADPRTRDLAPEERELYDFHAPVFGPLKAWADDFMAEHWEQYARKLAGGCAELGVRFLDLPAHRFEGWCFIDTTHMTDEGYRQAAEMIAAALPAR